MNRLLETDNCQIIALQDKVCCYYTLTDTCQQPFEGDSKGSTEGNWWLSMEELFHMD